MVLEVFPDFRRFGHHGNAVLAQQVRRADAGELEQLRRLDGAGREDHLALGTGRLQHAGLRPSHAGRDAAPGGPAQTSEAFPSTVDHRSDGTEGPIKNQGGVGSCTAHSLSSALDNAAIGTSIPFIVGEFGPVLQGQPVAWQQILNKAQSRKLGYLAWSWSGNDAETAALNIVNDFEGDLTPSWGQQVMVSHAASIQNTSVKASIFP